MCRAYTKEEVREKFLDQIRTYIWYWAKLEDYFHQTIESKLEGLANSILAIIDGSTTMPPFDLIVRPHSEDKEFLIGEGENYYEDGMVINNDTMLHEIFYKK